MESEKLTVVKEDDNKPSTSNKNKPELATSNKPCESCEKYNEASKYITTEIISSKSILSSKSSKKCKKKTGAVNTKDKPCEATGIMVTKEKLFSQAMSPKDFKEKVKSMKPKNPCKVPPEKETPIDPRSLPIRQYLTEYIEPIFGDALIALARELPLEPIEFLSSYIRTAKQRENEKFPNNLSGPPNP
ncbi:uncharacterized protein LOC119668757 [Teleopsis dalmanni]|uniref:uncharacterized protein LOC119668757 n=1 Tax=Teleopsis dalmanni TaxID=139649 RepID=UPI0018CED426|nr:uncharacterized protein LOC119668757 [Teleopsis dalmanni]